MPLEIRELVIKASLSDADSATNSGSARPQQGEASSEAIINACVAKVLEILKENTER